MNILFVEPNFPNNRKSKNHYEFMPIGLLKLASYHRKKGDAICIVSGEVDKESIYFEHPNGSFSKNQIPDKILITSYFTYWSKYVKISVQHYIKLYPNVKITVGGIYASLMPEHCKKYTKCDEVFIGIHEEAEKVPISFTYLEKHYGSVDYQIIHTSRGCIRRCDFCGVYKIEPDFTYKKSIKNEIIKEKLIFYDNNLLANPYIESILTELAFLKNKKKIKWCDPQSGIDGRVLEGNPNLAFLLKEAGFRTIRISWDGSITDAPHIYKQLKLLKKVGYNLQEDVFIFMIYNWDIGYEEMEEKRIKCWEWKVQISDCRYRPLNQKYDNYKGQKFRTGQTGRDYYIHKQVGWTDTKIRAFRKHIRRQNICIRLHIPFYSNIIERKYLNRKNTKLLILIARNLPSNKIKPILDRAKIPYWFPEAYNGKASELHTTDQMIYHEYQLETNKDPFYKSKESSSFKRWRDKHLISTLNEVTV